MTITAPGVYANIPGYIYHGQLMPAPSMSAGMAIDLIETCPRAMRHGCYLNPGYEPKNNTAFDLGSTGHLALLEPGQFIDRTAIVDADNYLTKAAREARDAAYAEGKTPLLPKHLDQVQGMRAAVLGDPIAGPAFSAGKAEETVVSIDPKTGVWMKCRPDKRADDWMWVADVKTTTSANPRDLRRKAYDYGWAQRAEWYLDTIQGATGIRPVAYFFVVVEVKPPHLVTVCRFRPRIGDKPSALSWAAKMNRRAIDIFAECVAANRWPGYSDRVVDLELPTYAEFQLEERAANGDFGEV